MHRRRAPTTLHVQPDGYSTVRQGLYLTEKLNEQRRRRAERGCFDTVMRTVYQQQFKVFYICSMLLFLAYLSGAYYSSYLMAERRISKCTNAVEDWKNHTEIYEETLDFINSCLITSQLSVWRYAADIFVLESRPISFLRDRFNTFGSSLDSALAQHWILIVVFLAVVAMIITGFCFIIIEWIRQRTKISTAQTQLQDRVGQ